MIKDRWQQLAPRERQMLMLMTAVVVMTLFYFMLWEPLQEGIRTGRNHIKAQNRQLHEMQQQAAEARQLRGQGATSRRSVTDSASLLGLIERTAKQKQLHGALQKVQPEGQDGVRIWMENAAFDHLIGWLAMLTRQHGVDVSEITIERQDAPGRVNSRILLRVST